MDNQIKAARQAVFDQLAEAHDVASELERSNYYSEGAIERRKELRILLRAALELCRD